MDNLGYEMSERITVLDEPEYTASYHMVDLGEDRVMTFVHLDVYYLSKTILKRLDREWALFRQYVPVVLYCMSEVDDEKWARFISRFGFSYLCDVGCSDGRTRRLFVNYGPQPERPKEI